MPDPIEHVIVLMLENSSFDRMLGALPGIDGIVPSKLEENPDFPPDRPPVERRTTTERTMAHDPEHDLDNVINQINHGKNDGFVEDFAQHYPQSDPDSRSEVMAYYDRGALPVLHTLAESFAICDHWFSSLPGPTWPNRFFVHSGTSQGHTDMPEGIFHPNLHIYDQVTVYDRLEEQGKTWAIYYGDFPQSIVMTHQERYPFHYHHMDRFYADVTGPADQFPQYTFIEPTYFGAEQNDQHPPSDIMRGEALIAQVYNAIRANADLWNSSLLVVLYDEHGGFYDHVVPGPAVPPDGNTKEFAFDTYGVRVPAILVSPWIEPAPLHDVFDHTSLLKYVTDKWGLGPLGNRTAAANTFAERFLALNAPRDDTPAMIAVPEIVANPVTGGTNAQQASLVGFGRSLEAKNFQQGTAAGADPQKLQAEIGERLVRSMSGIGQHEEVAVERFEKFLGGLKGVTRGAPGGA
jgi:phospholipase C